MKDTLLAFNISDFPGCCGAGVIHDLATGTEKERDEADWDGPRYDYPRDIPDADDEPMLLATTMPQQREVIALLEKGGFRKLVSWAGVHGNRITLWGKATPKARARYK